MFGFKGVATLLRQWSKGAKHEPPKARYLCRIRHAAALDQYFEPGLIGDDRVLQGCFTLASSAGYDCAGPDYEVEHIYLQRFPIAFAAVPQVDLRLDLAPTEAAHLAIGPLQLVDIAATHFELRFRHPGGLDRERLPFRFTARGPQIRRQSPSALCQLHLPVGPRLSPEVSL